MTNELRDLIIDKLSVSDDHSFTGGYFYETGCNNYLLGSVIVEDTPLTELPCDGYRDFECNCTHCNRKLVVTDWPTDQFMMKVMTCRQVDWKPQVEVFEGCLKRYVFREQAFVEKVAEAADALGRVQKRNGYWYCGNVRPPRNGKPRPFFVCMDPDRARLDEIDLNTRPVLLSVAIKYPKIAIQTLHFDTCMVLDSLGWKIDRAFFIDDFYPKDGPVAVSRIGEMSVGDFWAKQKTIVEEASLEERDYIVAEIRKLKPFMPRPAKSILRQEDVAEDFGVTRQTINEWENTQTVDGPDNTSNPYHYYMSLRTNPDLRGSYEMLANAAKAYNKVKEEAKAKGKRFRMVFETFNEMWLKHNDAKTRHLE